MDLPGDVAGVVGAFAKDPVQNVLLYRLLNENTAKLHAHVYRVNGIIEAKCPCEGLVVEPFRVHTVASLQAFVRGCATWQPIGLDCYLVVYRGRQPPPLQFRSEPGKFVWIEARKHFLPALQRDELIDNYEADENGRDPVSAFGEYAWELLSQKNHSG